jgi:hypothetical protein
VAFLGDPNFPRYGVEASQGGNLYSFQRLYEQYSTLAFSYPEDRASAIRGLEQRLAHSFKCLGAHGIFALWLGRCLLWRRAANVPAMKKIPFNPESNRGRRSPTWSWMKYEGGIGYVDPKGHTVKWNQSITWPTSDNKEQMRLEGEARRFTYPDIMDPRTVELTYDEEKPEDVDSLRCVVLGTDEVQERHYVLLVREMVTDDKERIWGRVGVGFLPVHFVDLLGSNISIK